MIVKSEKNVKFKATIPSPEEAKKLRESIRTLDEDIKKAKPEDWQLHKAGTPHKT